GLSRKAMIGALTGREGGAARAVGSAAAALIAVQRGAKIVRVHDVAATRDALAVWQAVAQGVASTKKAAQPFGSQRFGDDD
ncbi:MAG: dihydropteroate synthase, partial [Proteobacteria bacterium]|nr:dihydropteroate synthase [Pseudomonadota bacterium]